MALLMINDYIFCLLLTSSDSLTYGVSFIMKGVIVYILNEMSSYLWFIDYIMFVQIVFYTSYLKIKLNIYVQLFI